MAMPSPDLFLELVYLLSFDTEATMFTPVVSSALETRPIPWFNSTMFNLDLILDFSITSSVLYEVPSLFWFKLPSCVSEIRSTIFPPNLEESADEKFSMMTMVDFSCALSEDSGTAIAVPSRFTTPV